ncbi:DUF6226 family protein [Corynebacterium sp. USCH3]|uniref:DUF6226 family protein n=1 Tax=Corynebacterium sp. USCH3 TaxID=3024840 RepID=UPI0030AA5972
MKDEILAAVDREYATDPLSAVTWDDPHPDLEVRYIRDEEYSRVTDPGRFRIVGARVDAWERALVGLGLAHAEPVVTPSGWNQAPSQEAAMLVPSAEGARPLVLAKPELDGVQGSVLVTGIGVAGKRNEIEELGFAPTCGCDACDSGSDSFLEEVDNAVWRVVGGFIRIAGDGWFVERSSVGGLMSSDGDVEPPVDIDDIDEQVDRARAGKITRGHVLIGEPWWAGLERRNGSYRATALPQRRR